MQIRDERFDCPTSGITGVKRACNPTGNYSDLVGARIELWDWDDGGFAQDDYIGAWYIGATGTNCATFEWENAPYAAGEPQPDVYLRLDMEVAHSGVIGPALQGDYDSGVQYPMTTWRDHTMVSNCTGTCTMPAILRPTADPAADKSQVLMMLDSAQRVLEIYGPDMEHIYTQARYPGSGCPTGSSTSRTDICIPSGLGAEGDRVAHEMGHMVQKHMFHQDDLRSVLIGGWTMSSVETDSGATTEGWAAYVGAVAWYDPQNTSGVAPLFGGMNIEAEGALNCAQNRSVPGQVARAFWDYDDATNEPSSLGLYPDASSKNTAWMARVWDLFPDGTGDDQDYESGDHGVNVQDYRGWAELTYDSFYTLISHNDLACQEPD